MMIKRLFSVLTETGTYTLITWYPNRFIPIRMVCLLGGCKPLDLDRGTFTISLNLDDG